MKTEVRIKMNKYGDRPELQVNERLRLEEEGKLAATFIEKWGMVAAEDDGEDSAGRHKLRLATPEAVVERAFKMARLLMQAAENRGLTYLLPTLAEIDEVEAQHAAEKEAKKKVTA